jgi:hypothetical protein
MVAAIGLVVAGGALRAGAAGPAGAGNQPHADAIREHVQRGETDKAASLVEEALREDPASVSVDWCLQVANHFKKERQYDRAVHFYRLGASIVGPRVIDIQHARGCQTELVGTLIEQGKGDEALAEAKRLYMMSHLKEIDKAMAAVLKALACAEGGVGERASIFMDYQRFGPAGPDGKSGTEDDLKDPLRKVTQGPLKEHAHLETFVKALDAIDSRTRGYVLLVKGDAEGALSEMRSAYAVAGGGELSEAVCDVAAAIKAVDGHPLRANRYIEFQKFGPVGKDGRPGTPDDLRDPILGTALWLGAERRRELDDEIAACPPGYEGTRRRAYLLLASGRTDEGLEKMLFACRMSGSSPAASASAINDVAAAIKAADGHILRANKYLRYQKYGPAGPDGARGTGDDLGDPLP